MKRRPKIVRLIFERYLALGSLPALQRELRGQGIVTRRRNLVIGANHRRRSANQRTAGLHAAQPGLSGRDQSSRQELSRRASADRRPAMFDAVQAKLDDNRPAAAQRQQRSEALFWANCLTIVATG